MSSAVIVSVAALALRSSPALSRRSAVAGLAAAGVALPASASKLLIDPIGAYSFGGGAGDQIGQVPENARSDGKPNSGIYLLRECFDGGLPARGLLEWYEEHLTPGFTASFAGGKVVLDRAAYLATTADILRSFPDFTYTRTGPMEYDGPTLVTWRAVVKGTHSGKPFSPLAGVPPVAAKSPAVACANDPEQVTAYFESGTGLTKIKRLKVDVLPGGRGYSGPVGFYLQAGGDPAALPAL